MVMTLELPDELADAVREEARRLGKDPAQLAIEQMTNFYAIAKHIPAHLDPRRSKTMNQWTNDVRSRHGFPDDWGTKPVTLSAGDWAALEAACEDMYLGYSEVAGTVRVRHAAMLPVSQSGEDEE